MFSISFPINPRKPFAWPDFNVNFISIKNLSICTFAIQAWLCSLNLAPALYCDFFAQQLNWIPNRNCKWMVVKISHVLPGARGFWVQSRRRKRWKRVIYPMIRRPCCLLPPPQPLPSIFPIENFLRGILPFTLRLNLEGWSVACLETGAVVSGDRGLNSRKPRVKNARFFRHTCTLQPLPVRFVCSSFE